MIGLLGVTLPAGIETWRKLVLLMAVAALATALSSGVAYGAANSVIDGPSADLTPNNAELDVSLDLAPDGTGAIAYLKKVGGFDEVMVSRRVNGEWLAPEQVSLHTGVNQASQPMVAVANDGKVVVIWRHGTNGLFSAVRDSAGGSWTPASPPTDVLGFNVAFVHDLDMNAGGVAYAVFVTSSAGAGVRDLRAARLGASGWEQVGTAPTSAGNAYPNLEGVLDAAEPAEVGDNSQSGPEVAVDAAGNAVVAWSEGTVGTDQKVYVRRITGTAPASAALLASPPDLAGAADTGTNDMLSLGTDDSGRAWIAWRYVADYAGMNIGRAVLRSLTGTALGPVLIRDGLPTPPPEAGEFPAVSIAPGGSGLFISRDQNDPYETFGSVLKSATGEWSEAEKLNSAPSSAPTAPAVAAAGGGRGIYAWRHDPGGGGARSVIARVRVADLRDQQTLSEPGLGSVAPIGPYAAANSATGVVAFGQGDAANRRLLVSEVEIPVPSADDGDDKTPRGDGKKKPRVKVPARPRHLRVTKRIRLAPRVAPKRVKRGGQVRFRLVRAGRFRISFERVLPGKRAGRKCVKPRSGLSNRPGCRRYARVKGAIKLRGRKGLNRVRFKGRIRKKAVLKPGRYRLTVVALGKTGRTSPPARAIFRVLPRR